MADSTITSIHDMRDLDRACAVSSELTYYLESPESLTDPQVGERLMATARSLETLAAKLGAVERLQRTNRSEVTASVTLSREQRDAIYEEIENILSFGKDLPMTLRDAAETKDHHRQWLRDFAWQLDACVQLLDQLGWELESGQDSYVLELDETVARFMDYLERVSLNRIEKEDLDALEAARLAQAAYREVVA